MRKPCTSTWYRVLHSTGSVTISCCCTFNFSLIMIPVSILLRAAFPAITSPPTHTYTLQTQMQNIMWSFSIFFEPELDFLVVRFILLWFLSTCVGMCSRVQMRASTPPGTGVAGCCEPPDIDTGTTPGSSGRAEHTLNYWAVIPVP